MDKSRPKRMRPKLGDIIEVPLGQHQRAYIQYINRHEEPPVFGAFVRVLDGIFDKPLETFDDLLSHREQFLAFFPVGTACARGFTRVVGHGVIPERLHKWPLFKAYNEHYETRERTWWLWDGKKSWQIGSLPPEYADLPNEEVIDLKVLIDRIRSGWRHADSVTGY